MNQDEMRARAYAAGRERALDEYRRKVATSGPLPIGFDFARYTNPYQRDRRPAYFQEWRNGFDEVVRYIAERLGSKFVEEFRHGTR